MNEIYSFKVIFLLCLAVIAITHDINSIYLNVFVLMGDSIIKIRRSWPLTVHIASLSTNYFYHFDTIATFGFITVGCVKFEV